MSIRELVKFEIDENKIGLVTINRAESLNALNRQVLEELAQILDKVEKSSVLVHGLILTGAEDKAFIAGADIKEMLDLSAEQAKEFSVFGQQVTLKMESLSVPIIACVNGFALGGGLEMALGADFIFCSASAVFGLPEVKLGLIPGFGGTQRLARAVGRNLARELIYTGRNVDSKEALSISLVNASFETKEAMVDAAKKVLVKMKKNSLFAIAKAKESLNKGCDIDLTEALVTEANIFGELFTSNDAKEGTMAFVEKRKPNFSHIEE